MTKKKDADDTIDITDETCPMTYVRTRLALERLRPGQVLEVRLRGHDPARNVPLSAERQGHVVLSREFMPGGDIVLRIERK